MPRKWGDHQAGENVNPNINKAPKLGAEMKPLTTPLKKIFWTEQETETLLKLVSDLEKSTEDMHRSPTNFWSEISKKMKKRSPQSCKMKYGE